jgi:hypothetical protein
LATWDNESQHCRKKGNHNKQPKFTAMFIYQEQLTIEKYNKLISSGTDNTLGYPKVINCAEWTNYVENLFNRSTSRQLYLDCISPSTPSNRHPTENSHHCMD